MNVLTSFSQSGVGRRKEEYLSLLVIMFLKAYNDFNGIYIDYLEYEYDKNIDDKSIFFKRIKNLEESLFLDIEKKSHFIFGDDIDKNNTFTEIQTKYDDLQRYLTLKDNSIQKNEVKNIFYELRKSLLNKSMDINIKRIFHLLMIIKENFYELEYPEIKYIQEHDFAGKIESLFNKLEYKLNDSERDEFNHIKEIGSISRKIITDVKSHARMAADRCMTLFYETSEILLHVIHESRNNEFLILNMLREKELVNKVYGCNAYEHIFSKMYESMPNMGNTGLEKAVNYCKYSCGNITGLPEDMKYLVTDNSEGSQQIQEYKLFKRTEKCYFQENE